MRPTVYEIEGEFYMAGERVPPGTYKHVDSPYTLKLDREDTLPARLDGRATCYIRVEAWNGVSTLIYG
jgi:hypothetical protein